MKEEKGKVKIVFMGTPEIAAQSLQRIIEEGYDVNLVVTNPDAKSGRGMKFKASPVKEVAIKNNIEVFQPNRLKEKGVKEKIAGINPDYFVVVAYGKILPQEILDIPRKGAINLHGSLLPKYRGAAPIQWAVLNGDKITGVTTMYMSKGMDEGDILEKREVKIEDTDTTDTMFEKITEIGKELIVSTLEKLENDEIIPEKQNEELATYAPMIEKEFANISWSRPKKEILNKIRGLSFMGAKTKLGDVEYKIWQAVDVEEQEKQIILKNFKNIELPNEKQEKVKIYYSKSKMYIMFGIDLIEILEIQVKSKKRMKTSEFLAGSRQFI